MSGIVLRDLEIGDAGWLIQRHGEAYAEAEGFDASFEPLVAEILVGFLRHRDPSCERGWIAVDGRQRLGSIFCVKGATPGEAKLRLFFLEPAARGKGLGKQLLTTCLDYARASGYTRLQLWTHESHQAACALYARAGFEMTHSKPVHSFGVDLVEQVWAIDLRN